MTNKEAKDLLQAYADYTTVPELGRALETAVRLIDRVEELEKELRDERDRFDRYADYSVERDRMIEQLKEETVSVVRCKECRNAMLWRKPTDTVIGECLIRKMNSEDEHFCMVGANDFCSYGERRTDNG